MTMGAKTEVLVEALAEYLKASKELKSEILDRLAKTLRMHRKAIIRRLKTLQLRNEGVNWNDKRGRSVYYTPDVTAALKELWDIAHGMCAERMHPQINAYLNPLIRDAMWKHSNEATGKLRAMSMGTMKERISHFDKVVRGGGRSMTKPSSLKELIPVRRGPWHNPDPGFGEIDSVAHCGSDASGFFGYSIQYTDIALTWNLLEAQMGKDKAETRASIERMEARSPFAFLGLDPDTGSEFVNWHLYEWCTKRKIEMTRIRPGMKNDHGHIEQKNDTSIRRFAGYIRIDDEARLLILKELYATLEIYINHFQSSMKCIEKIRENISRTSRKYDEAQTPFQRFMAHSKIPKEAKNKMKEFHDSLDPKTLPDESQRLQKLLFKNARFTRNDI